MEVDIFNFSWGPENFKEVKYKVVVIILANEYIQSVIERNGCAKFAKGICQKLQQ